ncbi:MAG: caspase family protein [Verrucomicrobiaceae bacterium]
MKGLLGFLLVLTATVPGWSGDRVALVIGNNAYSGDGRLENPVRDARAVSGVLRQAGFEIIAVENAKVEQLYDGLERLKKQAEGGKIGLVFYAGHGVEVDGKNYLLPVDAELENAAQLRTQAVALDTVLADLKAARCEASLVILDCCRNNPLTRSWLRSRSLGGGLAEIGDAALPNSTMVMFSAGPGQQALDGTGENSPFTAALVQRMQQPGISLFDAFLGTSDEVSRMTGKRQEPWVKFDGAGRVFREFSFHAGHGPVPALTPMTPPVIPPPTPTPAVADKKAVLWSKGPLKAQLESFELNSQTEARAEVKVTNTSPDKQLKLAFDWEDPSGYSPNPPPGSDLHITGGATLSCVSASGINTLTFLDATTGRGVLGTPGDVIAQATDLGPNEEITLRLMYGLPSQVRGFGLSTDRNQKASSNNASPAHGRDYLIINLWQAEVKGDTFGPPARISIRLDDVKKASVW